MSEGDVKHKKSGGAKWIILSICIGLPILGVAGWFLGEPIRRHNKAQNDVNALLQAVRGYVSEQGDLPKGSFGTICRLLRGESIEGQNVKHLDYIEAQGQEVNDKGEFLDPWGHPYRIVYNKKLRVYSCGPSGRDEQGNGDNIVAE